MKIRPFYDEPKYLAYPWLDAPGTLFTCVDFEIETDTIASEIGIAISLCKDESVKQLLTNVCTQVYDANALLRNDKSLPIEYLEFIKNTYDKMCEEYIAKGFFLPIGTQLASKLHVLRAKCKKIVRMVYLTEDGCNKPELISYFSILSLVLFRLALNENNKNDKNIIFKSKVY